MHYETFFYNVWRSCSTCSFDAEAFSCHCRRLTQAVTSACADDDFYAEAKLTNDLSFFGKPRLETTRRLRGRVTQAAVNGNHC